MIALACVGYFIVALLVAYALGRYSLCDPEAASIFALAWPIAAPILLLHYAATCGEAKYGG